jgi:hypothetical protein
VEEAGGATMEKGAPADRIEAIGDPDAPVAKSPNPVLGLVVAARGKLSTPTEKCNRQANIGKFSALAKCAVYSSTGCRLPGA